jgi:ABC-type Na+ efflux pump permease subunit
MLVVCKVLWTFVAGMLLVVPGRPDPSVAEDAREERLLILKTADSIDLLQSESQKMRSQVESMGAEVLKLREENLALRQEIADFRKALDESNVARAEERKALLAEVAKLIAPGSKQTSTMAAGPSGHSGEPAPEKPVTEKGFYHVVEQGQTLSMIAKAFRDQGVQVTVEDIQKANSLGPKSIIRPGQKLFIPKG